MAMVMAFLNVVFCLSSLCVIIVSASSCNIPTRFWCDNVDVALQCGVYDQCKTFDWSLRHEAAEPVAFTLYYESLCPDCKLFITEMLYPTYVKLSAIMNLTLVPYGNARENKVGDHWEFECQHGKEECEGNIIETCAISLMKNISDYFPFINCMEQSSKNPKKAANECASKFSAPIKEILECSTSDTGNKLEHQMAAQTDALNPPHQYVPWVTLNGVHTEKIQNEAQDNLVKLICDTYKGTKPSACSQ